MIDTDLVLSLAGWQADWQLDRLTEFEPVREQADYLATVSKPGERIPLRQKYSTPLREIFVRSVLQGRPIAASIKGSIRSLGGLVATRTLHGASISSALDEIRSLKPAQIRSQVDAQLAGITLGDSSAVQVDNVVIGAAARHMFTTIATLVVSGGGGVASIPSPECIASHLPDGRPPTEDELLEAWELCSKNL